MKLFDEKFVKIGEYGVKPVPPEIIKRFISSEILKAREEGEILGRGALTPLGEAEARAKERARIVEIVEERKKLVAHSQRCGIMKDSYCDCGAVSIIQSLDDLRTKIGG